MTGHSMDLLSLLRLLTRHWRVTAPAAVLTLVGVVAAVQLASPTYQATGSVVLLSPPEAPGVQPGATAPPEVGQNPYVRYGDLAVVADILARVMDSDSRRAELEAQDVTAYAVVANRDVRGPVIEVTGDGPSAASAITSTEAVLADLDGVLSDLQEAEGADPGYFISAAPLEPPSAATAMYGSTVRAAIGALAFGGLCTLGLAVVAEAVVRRRGPGPVEEPGADHRSGRNGSRPDPQPVRPAPNGRSAHPRASSTGSGRQGRPALDEQLVPPSPDLRR